MILYLIIIFFVLFILALKFNDPLNKRFHRFYEDLKQRIADMMYGDKNDENGWD